MAYDYLDPSLSFDQQEQAMLQAAARIKALREMKAEPIDQPEGFTSAVTGTKFVAPRVKKPLLSSLTPLVQDTVAGNMEKELAAEKGRNVQSQIAALVKLAGETPQDTPYSAEPTNAPSATNPNGNFVEANVTPAREADPAAGAAHAAKIMGIPMGRAIGADYLKNQLVGLPTAAAAARANAREKALDRENASKNAKTRADGAAVGNFGEVFNEAGDIIGAFNKKTGITYMHDGRVIMPPGLAKEGAPALPLATGAGAAPAGAAPAPTAPVPVAAAPAGAAPPAALPVATGRMVNVPGVGPVDAAKITGYTPVGSAKAASKELMKRNEEAVVGYGNAHEGLSMLKEMREKVKAGGIETSELSEKLSDSKAWLGNRFPGIGLDGKTSVAVDNFKAFATMAAKINSYAERKMFGPVFSNSDVEQIQKSMGNLQRATSDEQRLTIIAELEAQFERRLDPQGYAAKKAAAEAKGAPTPAAAASAPAGAASAPAPAADGPKPASTPTAALGSRDNPYPPPKDRASLEKIQPGEYYRDRAGNLSTRGSR